MTSKNSPDSSTCARLCEEYASITNTSESIARWMLQNQNWDLEAAVNHFFASSSQLQPGSANPGSATGSTSSGSSGSLKSNGSSKSDSLPAKRFRSDDAIEVIDISPDKPITSQSPAVAAKKPDTFTILSWNIDGLDDQGLSNRTLGVCMEIQEKKPDVAYLQEVVEENLKILTQKLGSDYVIRTGGAVEYFTAILLSRRTMRFESETVTEFTTSRMGRNILTVTAEFDGIPLTLMTSHLESTKEGSAVTERKKQLRDCFDRMLKEHSPRTVIFGGDLNLRDAELKAISGIPKSIVDLYAAAGGRPELASTWDAQRNANAAEKLGRFAAPGRNIICRFDRLYFRPSEIDCALVPSQFNLVGLKKAPNSQRFPSDHWGIMVTFSRKLSRVIS